MKKIVLSLFMLFLAILTGMSQVTTVPVGTTGTFSATGSAGATVNKQFNISTGTNVCIDLTILGGSGSGTGSVPPIPYHGKFEFYDCDNSFGSLVKISESLDYSALSLNVVSRVPNGKMVVVFTFDGSSAYTFQASYRPGTNVISNTGPVTLDAVCPNTPNLTITDYTSKNMGSINSTTTDYTKSMILMKSGTYQLGLGASKISAYGNLGISSTAVLSQTASNFVFSTATVPNAFYITSTGNVLIGKTTQTVTTNKLDVNGNVSATKFIGEGASQWTTNGSNIYYNTGNIGIGTKTPEALLDVYGSTLPNIRISSATEGYLQLGIATCSGCFANCASTGDAVLRKMGGTNSLHLVMPNDNNDGNSVISIGDESVNARTFNVFNNGKVTIGTTNNTLDAKLEVAGNIKATKFIGEGASQWTTNGSNIYYNTGSVGIGTLTPSNKQGWDKVLDVCGLGNSKILTTTTDETIRTGIFSHGSWVPGGGGFIGTESSHPLYLIAGYDPKMTILTNGNVGIGITTPAQKLTIVSSNENLNSVAGLYNEVTGTSAQGKGAAINLGYNADNYYAKIAAVFENNSPLYLNPALAFYTMNETNAPGSEVERMRITSSGNVLIGKTTQSVTGVAKYKLDVEGAIRANEVVINADGRDIVFAPTYILRPLVEVESFIKQNQHLPEIAPAKDMQNNGVNISEFQMQLLQKVEELTLYMIEQEKRIKALEKENSELKK